MEGLAQVPPVRSMAALRARAGEAYRPLRQVEVAQPAPVPEPVVVPVPQKAAPVAIAPEPEWERPIQPLRPPFFRSAWETVLRYLPRLPQISE